MNSEYENYLNAAKSVSGSVESQMFGKPCFKINNKAFVSFFENCMVFKLGKNQHSKALSLEGSKLFDPSGKGRPMKEWVQVESHHYLWNELAKSAADYVQESLK